MAEIANDSGAPDGRAFKNYNLIKMLGLWFGASALASILLGPFHVGRALLESMQMASNRQPGGWGFAETSAFNLPLLEILSPVIAVLIVTGFFRFSKWRFGILAMLAIIAGALAFALQHGLLTRAFEPQNRFILPMLTGRALFPAIGLLVGLVLAKGAEYVLSRHGTNWPSGWAIAPRAETGGRWLLRIFVALCAISLCLNGGVLTANILAGLIASLIDVMEDSRRFFSVPRLLTVILYAIVALGIAILISRARQAWFRQASLPILGLALLVACIGFIVADVTLAIYLWISGSGLMAANLANSPLIDHMFNAQTLLSMALALLVIGVFWYFLRRPEPEFHEFSNPLRDLGLVAGEGKETPDGG